MIVSIPGVTFQVASVSQADSVGDQSGRERKKTEGAGPEGEIQDFGCGLSAI